MVKIQVVSDLHLEFRDKTSGLLKTAGEILILAGDICAVAYDNEDYNKFLEFIKSMSRKYKFIFHVSGNHEYYTNTPREISKDNTMDAVNRKLKKLEGQISNYNYLNCDVVTVDVNGKKYTFAGCTLWSYIQPKDRQLIQSSMNDYDQIYVLRNKLPVKLTVDYMQLLHSRHVSFIKKAVTLSKAISNPMIIITHHKPILDNTGLINQAYENDLAKVITPPVALAVHGHTHTHYNKIVNGVHHVSNPKGYVRQRTNFSDDFVVEIK